MKTLGGLGGNFLNSNSIKLINFLIFCFYVLALLYLYFIRFNNSMLGEIVKTNPDISLINLIPFKNISRYFVERNFMAISYNITFPFLLWLPLGYFVCSLNVKMSISKKILLAFIFSLLIYIVRLILGFGVFDVDKLIIVNISLFLSIAVTLTIKKLMASSLNFNIKN